MLASKLHWRVLIATVLILMAAAFSAPMVLPKPLMQENRILAATPRAPRGWADLERFRSEVDAYVGDRFPARAYLIPVLNRVRMMAGVSGSNRVLVGRDGWLFFDNDSHLGAARNDPPMTPEEIRSWLAGLAGRTEALKARGIAYVVVAPPLKESIYPEKAPGWFPEPSPERPSVLLSRLAREAAAGDVLYLGDAVAAAKAGGRAVYSRHDTHWNGYGAYAGYAAMMSWLQSKGLTEGPTPVSALRPATQRGGNMARDLAMMLGVASFVNLKFTHLIDDKAGQGIVTTYLSDRSDWTSPYVVDTGQSAKPVLLLTRDSFSTEIEPWLYKHFSRIILAHAQDGPFREDLIDRFNPDIVAIEMIEGGLPWIMSPAPPPSAAALTRIDQALIRAKIGKTPPPPLMLYPTTSTNAALMDSAAPRGCNLETAAVKRVMGSAALTVGGWISEVGPVNTSPWGLLRLKGDKADVSGAIRVDRPRPDVAAYFKQPAAAKSGFSDTFQIAKLPPGSYLPAVYRRTATGWMACPSLTTLTVGE